MFILPGDFYPSDPAEPGPHLEELSLSSPILREDSEATSDNEDCDSVRNNFDIETLVDECFMSQYSGMRLSVPSCGLVSSHNSLYSLSDATRRRTVQEVELFQSSALCVSRIFGANPSLKMEIEVMN